MFSEGYECVLGRGQSRPGPHGVGRACADCIGGSQCPLDASFCLHFPLLCSLTSQHLEDAARVRDRSPNWEPGLRTPI